MRKVFVVFFRRKAPAFTLIELLVVVAIIGILASILLPALGRAKDHANAAFCMSNMHQWGLAFNVYCDDYSDYWPYDGNYNVAINDPSQTNAWHNVIPVYMNEPTLVKLYERGTPPTPMNRSVWMCPSSKNKGVKPTMDKPYFNYAFSTCMHKASSAKNTFMRNQMISPTTTIILAEEPEDTFGETNGKYAMARHSGGANFVFGDGHAEWIGYEQFCRECASNPFLYNDSTAGGDWKKGIKVHWWPYPNSSTAP